MGLLDSVLGFFNKTTPEATETMNLIKQKKLYTIMTDLHEGSPYLKTGVIVPHDKATIEKKNIWLLGDIKERKNCSSGDLLAINSDFEKLQLVYGERYILGNHEVSGSSSSRYTIADGHICMAHGDYILWGEQKANEFRNNKAGGDSGFIQKMLAKRNGSISNSEAKQLAQYAANLGCDVICIGHVHPSSLFDKTVNGVRVLCFPRGRTEIML